MLVGKTQRRLIASILTLALGVAGAFAQEAKKQKQVKDQAEYDLLMLVNKEPAGPKKIELLDQWKQKYPESDFREDRAMVYVQTYQQTGNGQGMWTACKNLLAINPKSAPALYFLMSLTTSLNDPSKFDEGEGYTKQFLELLPELYKDKTDANSLKERKTQEVAARKTFGQIAMTKKDYTKAEVLHTEYLKWEPNSGNISYALANAMLLQKKKEKQIPAMWHFARAAHYSGDDALPDASKKQLQAFFEKTYVNYHGSKDGMQEVIDAALKNPFPAEDWTILSQDQILQKKMDKIKAEDPQLYLWLQLKEGLNAAGGDQYWEQIKGSALPKFKGKVVSATPPARPKEIIVGISGAEVSEVKLILEQPVGKVDPGLEIEFEGAVPKEFAKDPFMITADIENAKVTGLPKAAGPAPRVLPKKAAGKKK
ncbi:MAG: hypothetical protein FJW31_02995 [Acidobacteria bacterium]|nr:hypothetical protein [Acidobacteriota bacterium]